ncbi:MAG: isoprenylcysteine carboxylmethyltransferase family protein [Phycisphaerales bacterium]|nr:isoprenylcysteine carboxylmethyltransferase family protein [Phycisphaerales bacterium]
MATPLAGAARAFSVTYLTFQGLSVVAFWLLLACVPSLRAAFVPAEVPSRLAFALGIADGVFFPASSLAAAAALHRSSRWALPLLWLHAGAAIYAALFAIGLWVVEPRLWLGAGLMLPVLVTPLAIAIAATVAGSSNSRPTPEPTPVAAFARTLVQALIFWLFFLVVLPAAIKAAEDSLGVPRVVAGEAARASVGLALFVLGSSLGLWSAGTMAIQGRGTPLPIDPTHRLVIAGPYAFVRNPMAIAGLVQGLGVATWFGSWLMVIYVLAGAIAWQIVIRPQEEAELLERFGERYAAYRTRVRCWFPTRRRTTDV